MAELSKKASEEYEYLKKGREYRCEKNIFDDFTQEERDAIFGKPPATVWENVKIMKENAEKVKALLSGNSFTKPIIDSFIQTILFRWKNELIDRIIPYTESIVRGYKKLKCEDLLDEKRWEEINVLRRELAKDTVNSKCICSRLKDALETGDYDTASELQIEMMKKTEVLNDLYYVYKLNILD